MCYKNCHWFIIAQDGCCHLHLHYSNKSHIIKEHRNRHYWITAFYSCLTTNRNIHQRLHHRSSTWPIETHRQQGWLLNIAGETSSKYFCKSELGRCCCHSGKGDVSRESVYSFTVWDSQRADWLIHLFIREKPQQEVLLVSLQNLNTGCAVFALTQWTHTYFFIVSEKSSFVRHFSRQRMKKQHKMQANSTP